MATCTYLAQALARSPRSGKLPLACSQSWTLWRRSTPWPSMRPCVRARKDPDMAWRTRQGTVAHENTCSRCSGSLAVSSNHKHRLSAMACVGGCSWKLIAQLGLFLAALARMGSDFAMMLSKGCVAFRYTKRQHYDNPPTIVLVCWLCPCVCVLCVCVCGVTECPVTTISSRGRGSHLPSHANEAMEVWPEALRDASMRTCK